MTRSKTRCVGGVTLAMTEKGDPVEPALLAIADHCIAAVDAAWVKKRVVPLWKTLRNEGLVGPPLLIADLCAVLGRVPLGARCEGKRFPQRRVADEWRKLVWRLRSRMPVSRRDEEEGALLAECVRAIAAEFGWMDEGEQRHGSVSFAVAVEDEVRVATGRGVPTTRHGEARARFDRTLAQDATELGLLGPAPIALLNRREPFDFDPCVWGLLADAPVSLQPRRTPGRSGNARDPVAVAVPGGPFWKVRRSKLPEDLSRLVPIELMYLGTPELGAYWLWRAVTGELQTRFGRESRPSRKSPHVLVRVELVDDPASHRYPDTESCAMKYPPVSWLRATLIELLRAAASLGAEEDWRIWSEVAVVRPTGGRLHVSEFRSAPDDSGWLLGNPGQVLCRLATEVPALFQASHRELVSSTPRSLPPRSVDLCLRLVFGSRSVLNASLPASQLARMVHVSVAPSGQWGVAVAEGSGSELVSSVHHGEARASPSTAAHIVLTRALTTPSHGDRLPELEFTP
jgi:hypothetical protein